MYCQYLIGYFLRRWSLKYCPYLDAYLRIISQRNNAACTLCQLVAYEAHEKIVSGVLPVTECLAITSFHLRIRSMDLLTFPDEGSCIEEFMNAVRMPSLEDYTVHIDIRGIGDRNDECVEWSSKSGLLSNALLPEHFSKCASMTAMCYKLMPDAQYYAQVINKPKVKLIAV